MALVQTSSAIRAFWRHSLALLEATTLVAGYGGSAILNGLSITAEAGRITGLIGPNGAGKSTLLKTLMGYITPVSGTIAFDDEEITRLPTHERIRRGIAYIAQTQSHFPSQTVQENLRLGAYLVRDKSVREERQAEVFRRFPVLQERRRQYAGLLSGGQLRMLEIGRALMTSPRLIILDEPSVGLSPKLVDMVYDHLRELAGKGTTLLIVEQNVRKLLAVSDRVYALESGANRYDGAPQALVAEGRLANLYLGAGVG
jgi:ABC-type branched-subunit amino acid transport system ATPase component